MPEDPAAAREMDMQETDETLYRRFLSERSEDALRTLLQRHREGLTLFLYGYLRSWEDAEDLMLDAFAEVAAGRTFFAGKSSFKTWLFSIGRHLALRELRRCRVPLPFNENLEAETDSPETELLTAERDRQLYEALERLNPDYRQVLYLFYFEDMKPEEAARVMGKTRKQIYNLNERGRKALREELERMGFKDARYR